MSELQKRRDAQTRAELSEAAVALFSERGFAETTMEDVAREVGVSRRTVYRHYPAKEDLLFEDPRLWMEVFDAAAAERDVNESTEAVCRRAILAVTEHIKARREKILPGVRVVVSTPELRVRYARTNRDWLERYVALVAPDISDESGAAGLQAAVLAGALMGGTDGAMVAWFMAPETDLTELIEVVLDQVSPLWPSNS